MKLFHQDLEYSFVSVAYGMQSVPTEWMKNAAGIRKVS